MSIPTHDLELLRAPPGTSGAVRLRSQIFETATGWRELPLRGRLWRNRPPGCDHLRAWQTPTGAIVWTTEEYRTGRLSVDAWAYERAYRIAETKFRIHYPSLARMFLIWEPARLDMLPTLNTLDMVGQEYFQ
jgi:hypothetical protein